MGPGVVRASRRPPVIPRNPTPLIHMQLPWGEVGACGAKRLRVGST